MKDQTPTTRKEAKAIGSKVYFTGIPCKNGHTTTRRTDNGNCSQCMSDDRSKLYASGWRQKPNAEATRKKNLKWIERNPKDHWIIRAVSRAAKRAKEVGVPFDLTVDYIKSIFPDVCPVFGTEFMFVGNKVTKNESPSIDKIQAEKGYVMGNVAIISMKANIIKQNATSSEIRRVADWLESKGY